MMLIAVAAFVGCFSAQVAWHEVTSTNRLIRYALALLAGLVVTVGLCGVVGRIAALVHLPGF